MRHSCMTTAVSQNACSTSCCCCSAATCCCHLLLLYCPAAAHLLVPAQDVADGLAAGERLVDLHGGATGVRKHSVNTLRRNTHT
jgi:hypothetical protein